jgi:hypothetical protein
MAMEGFRTTDMDAKLTLLNVGPQSLISDNFQRMNNF